MTTLHTVADVRAAVKAAGSHWFDRDTIRFWGTRVRSGLYAGRIFVTGEHNYSRTSTRYSVRLATVTPEGFDIDTIGKFQAFADVADARDYARRAAAALRARPELDADGIAATLTEEV